MRIRYTGVAKFKSIGNQRLTLGTVILDGETSYKIDEVALGQYHRILSALVINPSRWNIEIMGKRVELEVA